MREVDVAIVGGGIAGIVAATKLIESGRDVLVLDKSKSVGGRLATRRINGGRADHGAQFFTVRTDQFQQLVDQWEQNGWVSKWFGENHARYKSMNGMNQLVKHIASEVPVQLSYKLNRIERDGDSYTLVSNEGDVVKARTVLLTPPAPQSLELLQSSDIMLSEYTIQSLSRIVFQPALVGLITLNEGVNTTLPNSGHQDADLPDGIERVVDSYSKGISNERLISIYATSELSKSLYREEDEVILAELLSRVSSFINSEHTASSQLKRWRYAQAEEVHSAPTLWVSDRESIVVAGDAFLRNDDQSGRTRIESAVLSGLAAANEINDRLEGKALV
ncbi:NAD(P)/FAD-dependent oxidoreductase [Guptibacillus hwajinpoensis]|uniref:NAD/FAD-dependent oxidoreductase n=1 Tax=Guptibacillus hwajinpoensis TaxID=208199 RepID=A0ABU0K1Z5_9BACL|nr:FAD-dependent oxidoreductase [Alkalihalobacillus hemicentroti]MDQ0482172.1 putative NAD/FAD-dependent oxidoreductase [Alkalihalobacillus hemicentroti]